MLAGKMPLQRCCSDPNLTRRPPQRSAKLQDPFADSSHQRARWRRNKHSSHIHFYATCAAEPASDAVALCHHRPRWNPGTSGSVNNTLVVCSYLSLSQQDQHVNTDETLLAAGRAIARHRSARGLSQEQLAEHAGLHRNYIGLVERGERNATLKTLIAIADALDVALGELFADVPTRRDSGGAR